jgi:hypothetical protein
MLSILRRFRKRGFRSEQLSVHMAGESFALPSLIGLLANPAMQGPRRLERDHARG